MTGTTITGTHTSEVILSNATTQNPATVAIGAHITAAGVALDGEPVTAWTITNYGTVQGTGTASAGVALFSGGVISNMSAGTLTAYTDGIYVNGGAGAVTNAGGVSGTGTSGSGIVLVAGGSVTNLSQGTISGNQAAGAGVVLSDGGTVDNQRTATISGNVGVFAATTAASVINQGSIQGSNDAVYLTGGGTVSNQSGGIISGGTYGVRTNGTVAATIVNQGLIASASKAAVGLLAGGYLSNAGTGVVTGSGYGIEAFNDPVTIVNAGSMAGQNVAAVALFAGGTVSNVGSGTMLGGLYGVVALNTAATVVNQGILRGTGSAGVQLREGGYVSNAGTGTITGGYFGVQIATLSASVANFGSISSSATYLIGETGFDAAGVDLAAGGVVSNGTAGDIRATWKGVEIGAVGYTVGGTVLNQGTIFASNSNGSTGAAVWIHGPGLISNAATGTIGGGKYGVVGYYQTTLVNFGSVDGTNFAFDPVNPGNADRVVVGPGAVFSGKVSGGNTLGASVVSTLELASGATAGRLSGLGTKYIDFAQIIIDSGATWTLSSVPAGYAVTVDGTLINEGTMAAPVTVAAGGAFRNGSGATIAGSGTAAVQGGAGATVVNAGLIDPANYGVYLPAGGTVTNVSGGTIVGSVAGVKIAGAAGTVINAGSIYGTGSPSYGVALTAGGTISNGAGGATTAVIQGFLDGVLGTGTASVQISNFATIAATDGVAGGYGIRVAGAATVSNIGTASLIVGNGGISIGQDGTVSNAGTISTLFDGYSAVTIGGSGQVSNLGSASLIDGWGGVSIDGTGSVTNAGTIFVSATGGAYFGVDIKAAGSVSNLGSASLIQGYRGGVSIGGNGIVSNAGTIEVSGTLLAYGVGIGGAGTVSNLGTASLIEGQDGISITGAGSVTNAGSIVADGIALGGVGVVLGAGGSVTNQSGATISGSIGIYGGLSNPLTVVDAGVISASSYAVQFAAGQADRLVVDPGAVFNGTVDGGNTYGASAISTLELAPGSGALSNIGSKYINFGQITVDAGATWDLTGNDAFAPGVTLTDSGTVTLDGSMAPSEIGFAGTAAFVKLTDAAAFNGGMYGFGRGDMLDIGVGTVGTVIQQYGQNGQNGQNGGPPVLTVLSNTGGTLFSATFSGTYGNAVGNATGTYAVNTLASGAVIAGPYELLTENGDTVLEQLPSSTWQWTGADPGNPDDPSNWTLVSGPGNQQGSPNSGDTALVNNGTIDFQRDGNLQGNTLYLTGTSEMNFVGDQTGYTTVKNDNTKFVPGISHNNPTTDPATLLSNDPVVSPADTTLNFAGYNVNEGSIVSDASPGSSLTLNVTQDGTAPGYFLNYGDIEADAGNTVTIAVSGTSELFNANLIYANGGTVVINGGTGIAGGYAPMLGGVALIGAGGTLVYNAGFPSGVAGSTPVFAFYDDTSGNTLKLEQLGQFTGRILGFQQGDTIDLGSTLSIGTIVVTADGRLLLESAGTVNTLVLSSGAYNIGTYAVTAVSAGTFAANGFTLTTGADGDTLLTTGVVDDVWNDTSGVWQTATAWSGNVVPGTASAAIIGYNTAGANGTLAPFVLTTGSVAVNVNALAEISTSATLQITSNTTVGTSSNEYPIQQIAGEIEITGGNTLTATELKQTTPAATLQIDPGGVLDLTGHSNLGFVNDGTLNEFTVANGTTFANGDSLALFVMGTATVDGGTINAGPVLSGSNVVSTGGLISIGQDGGATPATMIVENGATVTDTYAYLSSDPTSFGALTLTGEGTTWDNAGDPTDTYNTRGAMFVGDDNQASNQPSPAPSGTAQLLVENGAVLNDYSDGEIGHSADSAGSATITAGGVWNIGTSGASGGPGGFLNVGNAGSGTLVISDNGTVNILAGTGTYVSDGTTVTDAAGMAIAHSIGGDGTVDVSDGGLLDVTISATITGTGFGVGQNGHGVLDVFNGGTVSIAGGGISAGSDSTVIAVGTTVAGDGTILVGGTFDVDGTIENGNTSAVLVSTSGMSVGKAGTGTLYVTQAGTVQVSGGGINVGGSAGAYGFAEINGGLVEDTTNGLNVGASGTGTLDLINGGTISLTGGGINVGESAAAQGLLEIASGGLLTSTTNGMNVGMNAGSSGTLDVLDGGIYDLSTHGISVGVSATASGTILVDGTTSLINIATTDAGSAFSIGQSGTGDLTVQNGGSVLSGIGLNVGQAAGATGTVTVTGGGTFSATGTSGINVGDTGNGLLTIGVGQETLGVGDTVSAAGTVYASNFFDIAVGGTATTGTVVVNGGTLYDNGIFNVGNTGHGTLIVEGGGLVDQTGINFNIGASNGSHGTVAVAGGTLITAGNLDIGTGGSSGLLSVSSGTVTASAVTVGSGGSVSVGGGTAAALFSDSGSFLVGTVAAGAMTVQNNGTVSGIGVNTLQIAAGSTVAVNGGGTLEDFGDIAVGGPSSGTLVSSFGTIEGVGVTVASGGLFSAGNLTVGNAITQGDIGTLTIDTGGTVKATTLTENANGVITVNGGSLSVSGPATVGQLGENAQLTLQSGTVTTNGLSIGNSSTASGTVTVSGGLLDSATRISIGNLGDGLLQVDSGGSVIAGGLQLNNEGGADGTLIVNGGSLTDTGSFGLGNGGSGTAAATVEAGGVLSASGGGAIQLGSSSGTSTFVVSGGTLATSGGPLNLNPSGGTASLLVENGGTAITTYTGGGPAVDINATGSGIALVTVTGAGSVWDIDTVGNDQLAVGDNGSGGLTVSNGAVVNAGTQTIVLGNQASGTGVANVDGGNALLEGGNLLIGSGTSHGTLEIGSGGTVDVVSASVGQDGSLVLDGGLLDPLALTLNTGGVISGFGTLEANLSNNSTVTASGGALEVTGSVSGSGTLAIAAGGSLVLPGSVLPSQIIAFTANTGVLQIGSIGFSGTIGSGLHGDIQSGDTIVITGVTDATAANVVGANTLQIVSTSLGNIDLQLDPEQGFLGDYFHVNTVGGNAVVTESNVPCYLAGTRILTDRGEVLVEMLRIGNRVVTLDGSTKPIKWIGRRSYSGAIPTGQRDVIPILIRQGALGDGLPQRDLIVSPLHAMYCDGVLVPAEHLVNGVTVLRAPDIDPIRYFHIELEQHDVIYADGAPAETFVDCDSRSIFHNAAEFDALYPGDATPRWRYCAPRVEGGERLDAVKRAIDRLAGIALPEPGAPPGRLEGRLDGIEGGRIAGWAFHPDRPEAPVWLEILDGDGVIARLRARRYRADLEAAGVGDGRHGFELHLTGQMRTRREIRVRRVEDGVELDGSPLVIEARGAQALLEDARRVLAEAILDPADEATLDTLADELLHGVEALRQARAALAVLAKATPASGIAGSAATRQSAVGVGRAADAGTGPACRAMPPNGRHRRALIIDAQLPRPEHDAGSQAILSHAAALASLGFQVEFVAAHELARAEPASVALEQAGYVVHRAPHVASVEEVLRRHRNAFDVVYLHRLANAEAFAPLARAWQGRARLLYCVADLHHVRLARQAAVQASAEVADAARAMRVRELNAMRLCDAVITHSTAEAAYLAQVAPGAAVHVVAWTPLARPRTMPLAARQGVAAIGSWSHEPNVDAVRWLVSDIMPLVWDAAPRIELLVVGSGWPARVPWISDPRVRLVGEVTSIETLLGMPRLSVAPLRFGAGLKGKVLDSFACKVPCVMTPIAAEGFPLQGALPGLVAEDAAALAALIVRLHEEAPFHRAAAQDGLALAAQFSAAAVCSAMAAAVGPRQVAAAEVLAG